MNGYFNDDNDKNENKNQENKSSEGFSASWVDESGKGTPGESDNQGSNIYNNTGYTSPQGGSTQGDYSSGSSAQYAGDMNPENSAGAGDAGANQNEYNSYGGNVQYKWNYDDYQKALDSKGKKPKKKRGLKIFVITVCSVAAVAVISLAGVGITALLRNDGLLPMISGTSSGTTSATVINPNGPTLKTNSKPTTASSSTSSTSAASTTGLSMTAQQVYSNVKNSVVVIETYDLTSLEATGAGSGIIMSTDGYIITNEHVIDGASSIKVTLANKKEYTAKVIGYDLRTDLAVVKIDATGLTAATFGNSDQLSIAESVLAIGNSAGLGGSVTSGIVSALNMSVTTENNYTEKCIQTDAPINPGNSGGALVNMYGQVVGITSSKIEATGYEGMGFAIPINTAKPVIDSIIKYGYVTGRVKIGISVQAIDTSLAAARGYPQGLLIASIDSTSDAATKGLQKSDVITKINGVAATTYDAFYAEESKYKAGDSVELTIYRHSTNQTFTVSIKLAEDKGNTTTSSSSSSSNKSYGNGNGSNSQGSYSFGYGN